MAKLWQFLQGHPKKAFSKKVERGNQGKIFKNRPKSSPRLKGPKGFWRKWHNPLISMHLKTKDCERFWHKKRLKECPNCQVMAIFAWSPKTRIFWKSLKGGQGKFFKNRPKSSLRLKSSKALCRRWNYPQTTMLLRCKDWTRFWGKKAAPKVPERRSYGNFCKVTQNPHFLKKCKRGPNRDFSKIAQKDAAALKA